MEKSNVDFEFVTVEIDAADTAPPDGTGKEGNVDVDDPLLDDGTLQQDLSDYSVKIIEEEAPPVEDKESSKDVGAPTEKPKEAPAETEEEEKVNGIVTPHHLVAPKPKSTKKKKGKKGNPLMVCKECGYKTTGVKHMERHRRTHTGDKPYVCTICDFRTAHPSSYRRHLNIHNGIKPYACTECNYRTAYRHHLDSHLSNHTGVKPFSCHLCTYQTAYRHHLENHLVVHSGFKGYSCTECSYSTSHATSLRKHIKRHAEKALLGQPPYHDYTMPYGEEHQYLENPNSEEMAEEDCAMDEGYNHQSHFMAISADTFDCDECSFQGMHLEQLRQHAMVHKQEILTAESAESAAILDD